MKRTRPLPTSPRAILFVHATEVMAGGERSLLNLARHLDPSRFLAQVACDAGEEFIALMADAGVPAHRLEFPGLRPPGLETWRTARRLAAICRAQSISLLHANTPRTNLYAGLAGRLARIPVVWHCRNLLAPGMRDTDRWFGWLPDRILCNSDAIAARFVGCRWQDRVVTIINGVNLAEFHPDISTADIRRELGWENHPILIASSRLDPEKGHDTLLKAMQIVVAEFPSTRMVIAGRAAANPVERHALLELRIQELNLTGVVKLLGFRRDIPELLAAAEISVLPAEAEACGRVLFEAMAMTKPVVATASGGTPEIVMDGVTGLLVPPKNPAALAEALVALMEDPARRRAMGLAGRKRVEKHFTIQTHAGRTMDLYDDILRGRASG